MYSVIWNQSYRLRRWRKNWQPIVINLNNTVWTCKWNLANDTNNSSNHWIYYVMIIWENSIRPSNFVPLRCNWIMSTLPKVPIYVYFLNVTHNFVLDVIMTRGIPPPWSFLFLLSPVWSKYNTFQAFFYKLTSWHSLVSRIFFQKHAVEANTYARFGYGPLTIWNHTWGKCSR